MEPSPEQIVDELRIHLEEAESRAWEALSRYKFQQFGYWAAIWIHLNRISGGNRPNPWRKLVLAAREAENLAMSGVATCRVCGCTEDEPCDGGCYWVEDPEGLGDLCSNCLVRLYKELEAAIHAECCRCAMHNKDLGRAEDCRCDTCPLWPHRPGRREEAKP